ncbi:hypothetical protein ACTFIW_012068 [Dictyostelium discoideum]
MKSMEDQINNLSLAFTRFVKEHLFSSNTNSHSQRSHDDSDTDNEQSDDESSNNVDVPTDNQFSDTLLGHLKPLHLMSSMLSSDSPNVDCAIVLAVNTQASLSLVRRSNIAKEIYGSEVLLAIKIKDTQKMFDETDTERVKKLAKSIRKNNEATPTEVESFHSDC